MPSAMLHRRAHTLLGACLPAAGLGLGAAERRLQRGVALLEVVVEVTGILGQGLLGALRGEAWGDGWGPGRAGWRQAAGCGRQADGAHTVPP